MKRQAKISLYFALHLGSAVVRSNSSTCRLRRRGRRYWRMSCPERTFILIDGGASSTLIVQHPGSNQ